MNGFDRLKKMLNEWLEKHKNDEAFEQIVNYLLNRPDLEPKYLNEEKNLEGLNDFIQGRGKKHLSDGWCYITNEIVYCWAVMYFSLPNALLKITTKQENDTTKKSAKIATKNNVVSLKEAKQKIENKKNNEQISLFGGVS